MRLAVMEHNENTGRSVVGVSTKYSKPAKAWVPKPIKEAKTFDFRTQLVLHSIQNRKLQIIFSEE